MEPFILDEELTDFEPRWLGTMEVHLLQLDKDFKNIYTITFGTPDEVRAARAALSAEELKRVERMAMCTLRSCMAPTLNLRLGVINMFDESKIDTPDGVVAWLGRMFNGSEPGAPWPRDDLRRQLLLDWTHFAGPGGEFDPDRYLNECMAVALRLNYGCGERQVVSKAELILAIVDGLPAEFEHLICSVHGAMIGQSSTLTVLDVVHALKRQHDRIMNDNDGYYAASNSAGGQGGGGNGRRRGRGRGRQQQRVGIKFENYH